MPSRTCESVLPQLATYVEGTLSDSEEWHLDRHLDQCEGCTARLGRLLGADAELQLPRRERSQLLRWLRASYTLAPEREHQGIEAIVAVARTLAPKAPSLTWAAAEISEIEEVRERMGAVFRQRGAIDCPPYAIELFVRDVYTALLAFNKNGQPTSELDGKTIVFEVTGAPSRETSTDAQTIASGVAILDLAALGRAIEDYTQVRFRLYIDAATVIEGSL